MTRFAILCAAMLACATLAACGPGEPSIDRAAEVDACTLLRSKDVATLLRAAVDPPQPLPGTTGECRYRVHEGRSAALVLTWRPKDLPGDEHRNFDSNRAFVFAPKPVHVGDDSYLGGAGFGQELHTLAGGDYLILAVPSKISEQPIIELMKKALSRR